MQLRGILHALNAYIKKEDLKSVISFHLMKLEREEQIKSKVCRRNEHYRKYL